MDAVIYAAGRALRLGARSAECPKLLLRFGGRSLLERHVMLLRQAGIRRIFVVTGHLRERIGDLLPALSRRAGLPVIEVYNPAYPEGSVLSVAVSIPILEAATEGALVMDGDVLYDQRILTRLLESPDRSALLLDRTYSTDDDDPVLVPIRAGRPFEFRKRWKGEADFVGESIGFFKIHPDDMPRLVADARRRSQGKHRGDSYDEIIRTLVKADTLAYVDVTGLPWTEVDFETDIDYGRDTILPQLQPLPTPPKQGSRRRGAARPRVARSRLPAP